MTASLGKRRKVRQNGKGGEGEDGAVIGRCAGAGQALGGAL